MQNRLWNDLRGFFESSKWDDAGKSFHAALKPTLNAVLIWEFRCLIILWEEAFGVWICFAQGILSSDSALPFPWLDENSNIIFTMYWIWQRWCLLLCISLVPYWVSCSGSNFYNFWFFILCFRTTLQSFLFIQKSLKGGQGLWWLNRLWWMFPRGIPRMRLATSWKPWSSATLNLLLMSQSG